MKRSILFTLLLVASSFAQSPTAFTRLDRQPISARMTDPYNAWAGAAFQYPLLGSEGDFNTNFGIHGKVVIGMTKLNLGREWHLLTYTNVGIPQQSKAVFNTLASQEDGIVVGLQSFTTFGTVYEKALTTIIGASAKLNSFGSQDVYSYRFETALELSLGSSENLPLILNVNPFYTLLNDKAQFASLQMESANKGFFGSSVSLILPIGSKLGLLVQGNFTEHVKPTVAAGIILSAGL